LLEGKTQAGKGVFVVTFATFINKLLQLRIRASATVLHYSISNDFVWLFDATTFGLEIRKKLVNHPRN